MRAEGCAGCPTDWGSRDARAPRHRRAGVRIVHRGPIGGIWLPTVRGFGRQRVEAWSRTVRAAASSRPTAYLELSCRDIAGTQMRPRPGAMTRGAAPPGAAGADA